jgi:hypothetical protein
LAEDRSRITERQELKRLMNTWMQRTGDKPWPVS